MDAPTPVSSTPSVGMKYIWGAFRSWDVKAVALKSKISRWRSMVLCLTIGGTVIAMLSQQLSGPLGRIFSWLPQGFGVTSAVCLGLAGFFTREILKPSTQSEQVRTRSAAEGLKTEAYLLAACAPPYDTATGKAVFDKAERINEAVNDLTPALLTDAEKIQGILPENLTVDQYIALRVDDQRNTFYIPQARKNASKVTVGQGISLTLGAFAVVLGGLAIVSKSVSGWVTVIGTVVAAILAYQAAGRFQFLVVSYQATAARLERLRAEWEASGKTDADRDERNKFILNCEEAISIENSAWMAEWTKTK